MTAHQPKNILVTGGAGFIGSNFIRHILTKDPQAQIFNLDLLTYAGSLENLQHLPNPSRHHFIEGNICDTELVKDIFNKHSIDTVVHFAAESHVDRSIASAEPFIQTNLVGTFVLLDAARAAWQTGQGRFHHISTDEVYGSLSKTDLAFSETTPYDPRSPYSASKAGADHLVRAYYHTHKLPVTLSNCSNNYGPYQHTEKLIPTIIRAALQRQIIPIYGDGSNIRDWLYVEDHCSAVWEIVRRGQLGETYNIGGNNEQSNLHIAKTICQQLDSLHPTEQPTEQPRERLIEFVSDRPGHDWRYAINNDKIAAQLGWQPALNFERGLQLTLDFYLKQWQ